MADGECNAVFHVVSAATLPLVCMLQEATQDTLLSRTAGIATRRVSQAVLDIRDEYWRWRRTQVAQGLLPARETQAVPVAALQPFQPESARAGQHSAAQSAHAARQPTPGCGSGGVDDRGARAGMQSTASGSGAPPSNLFIFFHLMPWSLNQMRGMLMLRRLPSQSDGSSAHGVPE